MPIFLVVIGALSAVAGAVMIGFGFAIELSFGNSLIVAGTTAAVGGLVVFGLGAAVWQLRRIAELLAARQDLSRPYETAEGRGGPPRIAFPQRPKVEPKSEPAPREPVMPVRVGEEPAHPGVAFAPPSRTAEDLLSGGEEADEAPLSPVAAPRPSPAVVPPETAEAKPAAKSVSDGSGSPPAWREPMPEPPWRAPRAATGQRPFFDTLWAGERPVPQPEPGPADEKTAARASGLAAGEAARADVPIPPRAATEQDAGAVASAREMRAVAILKSGVVDGMGYTLYVDGSIEAELPQGTLRFKSIGDLRHHLEKNS